MSFWKENIGKWGELYEAMYSILGTTIDLFPLVGPDGSTGGIALPTATTFVSLTSTSSGQTATVTARQTASAIAPYSWGTAFDPTRKSNWQGIIPVFTLNGTSEHWDSPDAAQWTRVSGAVWSVGIWFKPRVVNAAMSLLSKYDNTTGATQIEWDCGMNASGQPYIHLHDDSVPARIGRYDATALVAGTWNHLIFESGGDASANLDVFVNGQALDDTDDNSGVYVTMEDKTSLLRIGARFGAAAREQYADGAIAGGPCGPWFVQAAVTAAQARRVYQLGRAALELT